MKKLFNYALLAVALLVGVNVNAAKPTHDQATTPNVYAIEQALNNGEDFTLPEGGDVDFVLECPLDLTIDGEATLDLNGHNLVYAYTPKQGVKDENWSQGRMINLMKGTLNVTNGKIATGGNIENRTDTVPGSFNKSIDAWEGKFAFGYYASNEATTLTNGSEIVVFSVTGSANPADKNYTVLNIDPVVTVSATKGKVGIIINKKADMFTNYAWSYQYYNPTIEHKVVTKYTETTANKNIGLSYGVVVNVGGKVHGEKYGIQVSGNVSAAPGDNSKYYRENSVASKPESGSSKFWNFQYLNGHTQAEVTIAETAAFPIIWIKSTAEVWANPTAMVNGNGLYVGGYAQVTINGYVHGSNGVYAKSGDIDIEDAVIASDNPNYSETGGNKAGSGTEGAGNAIVIESTSGYAGGTDVTISGDTKVEAQSGYAIQEVVTKGGETKVNGVTIEGGTFIGGTEGGVIFSEETTTGGEGATSKVDITGGNFNKDDVEDYVNKGGEGGNTVVTTITDANGQVIGTVITKDENAPTPEQKAQYINTTEKTVMDTIKYLYWEKPEVGGTAPVVTITNGETLHLRNFTANWGHITVEKGGKLIFDSLPAATDGGVGIQTKVILNGRGYIDVLPGGTLISNSKLGIETAATGNLWIGAKEDEMAQFLYHPSVNQGRHPLATVEYHSKGCNNTNFDRFGVPSYEAMTPAQMGGEQGVITTIFKYNSAIDNWVKLNAGDKMKPFEGLTMTNNSTTSGHIYQFPCNVYGNVNAEIIAINGWNSFSNSYTADADIKAMIQSVFTTYGANLEGGMFVYKNGAATTEWYDISAQDCKDGATILESLAPMQAFLIRMYNGDHIQFGINYEQNVWNPVMNPTPAPAPRQGIVDMNKVVITLADAQGHDTRLTIREAAEFSADFDNGADMSAFMNENRFNFYATTDYAAQCQIATDNIEGQVLTLATKGETSFTMSFSNVRGEKMALVDNMTGDVIEMAEGVTYNFIANANEVSERFTVVSAAKAPTALENAAAKAKAAKFVNNGQIVLQNNGRMFNVLGAEVK